MIAKGRIAVGDQLPYKSTWLREESLLLRSEHHPELCEALQGAAVLVPSPVSLCPGSRGSKKTWTRWGAPSRHKSVPRRLISEAPSKSLEIPYEQWKPKGFCLNSVATSAAVLLLLEYDACSLAMLEVWNLFIPCWSERPVWNVTLFYIYIFLLNSVVLLSAFGC